MSETQRNSTKATYKAVVHDEAGGYWPEVPDLPGCFTQGDTLALYQNLLEAIACHLDVGMTSVRVGLLEMAVA